MDYSKIVTIEPGKMGGKPCIRGLRITVYDVLDYLASGMTEDEILHDFPDLTRDDLELVSRSQRTASATRQHPSVKLLFDENLSHVLAARSQTVTASLNMCATWAKDLSRRRHMDVRCEQTTRDRHEGFRLSATEFLHGLPPKVIWIGLQQQLTFGS